MSRRKARELAFKVLFQIDQVDADPRAAFDYLLKEAPLSEKDSQFAWDLIEGAVARLEAIDANIAQYSKEWTIQRMPSVDRNLLRLASFEILYMEGAQAIVAIDEAIEISKRYSEPASVGFINAILDKIRERKPSLK
ncbi:MAG: transcription antitermination factor NusB [Syntrophomonas sp.]|nr:transcription antitermination factor NusB [Syntrophomonas sp.]